MDSSHYILITGGAGFIGTNLADHLARQGHRVLIYDNLCRAGVERNAAWLRQQHPQRVEFLKADIRDSGKLLEAVSRANTVYHLAAQVAVTSSLSNPLYDFDVNARATLELLEAIRAQSEPPALVFTSTNKVLGSLESVSLRETKTRYEPVDGELRSHGIGESFGLQFCSPYGSSKGAADQYVLDYAHTFGIPATVFRMSCIYGPHQCGTADQGWVAHFIKRILQSEPITIYGDGKQVRDVLYIDDLVDALCRAANQIEQLAGQAFNIGGGPAFTVSLTELLAHLGLLNGESPLVSFQPWRPADQRYFVSDTRNFRRATGWEPRMPPEKGVQALYQWLKLKQEQAGEEVSPAVAEALTTRESFAC